MFELIAATAQRNAFGHIVELNTQANAATTGSLGSARGTLNIVEVEVYTPVFQTPQLPHADSHKS